MINTLVKYTDLVDIFKSSNKDGDKIWKFKNITGHIKLTDDYWEVKSMWYNGK